MSQMHSEVNSRKIVSQMLSEYISAEKELNVTDAF